VRAGIWTEREAVRVGGVSQVVERDAWLNARRARRPVDADNVIEMLGRVDDHRDVATLTCDACSRAAAEDGCAMAAADRYRVDDVVSRPRNDHTYRSVAVIRGIGCVERPIRGLETHLAGYGVREIAGQTGGRV
jgi:hypothetical protein